MASTHLAASSRFDIRSDDGTRINVEVRGPEDGPTVVFSHCWSTSLASWGPVVRALDAGLRVVLYDQRGHGRSQTPRAEGYSTAALADDLCSVLEATVPAGEKAVVCGHSLGGMAVMASALRIRFRERTAAALLTNTGCAELLGPTGLLPLPRPLERLAHRLVLTAPVPLGPVTSAGAAALRFLVLAPRTDPRTVRLCARLVHDCATVPRARWGGVLASLDLDAHVRALDVPTTVVVGDLDRLTPPRYAHHIADLLPRCERTVEIPGLAHMAPLEAPDQFARLVEELAADHLVRASAGTGVPARQTVPMS